VDSFGLTERDLAQANGLVQHRYDHVRQNIELAGRFSQVKDL